MTLTRLTSLLLFVVCLSACGSSKPGGEGTPVQRAERLWTNRCAACHGDDGAGKGPAAPGIRIDPRDFTQRGWQEAVTNERIRKVIVEGGPAVGLSHVMSENPDLKDDPEVVKELVNVVRAKGGFGPDGKPLQPATK